ncbi:MAG: hypothetical protein HRT42_09730 [Campylobacteraceae bacterium]|nr:hypothetical protein [Campylobacteraceae bacterium]
MEINEFLSNSFDSKEKSMYKLKHKQINDSFSKSFSDTLAQNNVDNISNVENSNKVKEDLNNSASLNKAFLEFL